MFNPSLPQLIDSGNDLTTEHLVKRIYDNRRQYLERNQKKQKKEIDMMRNLELVRFVTYDHTQDIFQSVISQILCKINDLQLFKDCSISEQAERS